MSLLAFKIISVPVSTKQAIPRLRLSSSRFGLLICVSRLANTKKKKHKQSRMFFPAWLGHYPFMVFCTKKKTINIPAAFSNIFPPLSDDMVTLEHLGNNKSTSIIMVFSMKKKFIILALSCVLPPMSIVHP